MVVVVVVEFICTPHSTLEGIFLVSWPSQQCTVQIYIFFIIIIIIHFSQHRWGRLRRSLQAPTSYYMLLYKFTIFLKKRKQKKGGKGKTGTGKNLKSYEISFVAGTES